MNAQNLYKQLKSRLQMLRMGGRYSAGSAQRGFTLIETFIAITILMLALAGPMSLAQKSLKASSMSKDRTTAYFLGQEGIEYLKMLRDTSVDWSTFITLITPCLAPSTCQVDPVQSLINSPTYTQGLPAACTGSCPNLLYNTSGAYYTYVSSGTRTTQYRRVLSLERSGTDEVKVTSTVYFPTGQPIVLKSSIFNVPRY